MFNRMRRALREPPEHVAFKLYPLREYNELCVRAAQTLFPRAPLGQGLWRVGEVAAKAFTESMAGKTFMTLADGQLLKAVRGLPRAYQDVQDHGRVEIIGPKMRSSW